MELFDNHSMTWLALMLTVLLATGAVAGLLAGLLGVGGGIVIVPVLYHLFTLLGLDESVKMHMAVGTSLATIIPTSIISARAHARRGSIDPHLLRALAPALFVGVLLGTWLSGILKSTTLTIMFGLLGLFVATNMLVRKPVTAIAEGLPKTPLKQIIGAAIGGLSTLLGIGGGTLSVTTFCLFSYPIHRAVGTAAAIGVIISIPGAIGFIFTGLGIPDRPPASLGYVNWVGVALIVPMTVLTAPLGVRLAHAINADRLRLLFAVFLLLSSARMFYSVLS